MDLSNRMLSNENENPVDNSVINSEPIKIMETKSRNIFHIDKKMLHYKIHYFLYIGALGTTIPYIAIFAMNRIGLSATSYGTMMTVQQLIFIVTKPLIGYIADYLHKLKMMIAGLITLQSIFFFMILTVPKIERQTVVNDKIGSNYTFLQSCLKNYNHSGCLKFFDTGSVSVKFFAIAENSQPCGFIPSNFDSPMNFDNTRVANLSGITTLCTKNLTGLRNCKNITCENSAIIFRICCNISEDCSLEYCNQTKNGIIDAFDQISDFQTYQFWLFSVILTIAMVCANSLATLSDTACCETIRSSNSEFGRQRLFGALGWGIMVVIGGFLNDYTQDYVIGWIVYGIISMLSLWNLKNMVLVMPSISSNIVTDVGTVLKSPAFFSFTLSVFIIGIGSSAIWFYLVWFLTKIGGNSFLCGMAHFIQCFFGEIPFMFFSGWLIRKLGHFLVLTLTLLTYGVRFLWYSQLYNPWFVLPVEILHGVTYGAFISLVASYAKLSAKPGTEATTQAILFTIHDGLGAGFGCLLFGASFDIFGEHATFLVASIFAFAATIASFLLNFWLQRRIKSND